jgi:hypothetical protein
VSRQYDRALDRGIARRNRFARGGVVHPRIAMDVEATMPLILWLLGVPLSVIIVLALLGVF